MDSSTSVENPVNQIAELLTGGPEKVPLEAEQPQPDENQEADQTDESPLDESQPEETLGESQEAQEGEIDTLNNLADELDIPVADLYALNLNMGGDDAAQTIGGLKDFYESNKGIEAEREALTKREQDLKIQTDELREIPVVTNELMQARAAVLSIQDQYNRTDWQAMRFNNPAEYSALQSDFHNQFELAKQNEARAAKIVGENKTEYRRRQQERLLEALPELKDETVRKQTNDALTAYVGRYGISEKEFDDIDDSRVLRMLIDASKANTAKETVKAKQVDKTPTANAPAPKRQEVGRKAALKRLTERAKAKGATRKDQINAVSALIGGGS